MSRSRKKRPISKLGGGSSEKKSANRKIRKLELIGNQKGCQYKKLYPQYDVIDYRFYCSKLQAGDWKDWEKYYYRK